MIRQLQKDFWKQKGNAQSERDREIFLKCHILCENDNN